MSVPADRLIQVTSKICIGAMEKFFFQWGKLVATHPIKVIVATLALTAVIGIGLRDFRFETDAEKLWLPDNSTYLWNKKWKYDNFREEERIHASLLTHQDNVLTPEAMIKLYEIHRAVNDLEVEGKRYKDFCFMVPITDITLASSKRRRRRELPSTERSVKDSVAEANVIVDDRLFPTQPTFEDVTEQYFEDDPKQYLSAIEFPGAVQVPDDDKISEVYDDYFNFYGNNNYVDEPESVTTEASKKNKKKGDADEDDDDDDFVDSLPPDIYCDLIETLNDKCAEYSLLELWRFDEQVIRSLTQQDILDAINTAKKSPVFGYKTNYTDYLGEVTLNSTGHVIGAKSIRNSWLATFDPSKKAVDSKDVLKSGITLNLADPFTMEYELQLIERLLTMANETSLQTEGLGLLISVSRSFGDITDSSISFDIIKMCGGYLLMFVYTVFMLGRLNMVEHKTWLALAGITSVLLGLLIALSLTMVLGFAYTTIHGVLPFLAMGIGIDDMFVIVQCYNNLPEHQKATHSLTERIALTMKHAGVAITVTSLTDVLAFCAGAITILPGLQGFCVSSAIAVGVIYFLQCSWFIAWLTLDQMRIEANRDGLIPFIKHNNWKPSAWSHKDWSRSNMGKLAGYLKFRTFQCIVILIAIGLFSVGLYGTLNIKVEFDHNNLLPKSSYLRQFIDTNEVQFPSTGWPATVYVGHIDYSVEDFEKLDTMVDRFDNLLVEEHFLTEVEFWWTDLKVFLAEKRNISNWRDAFNDPNTFRLYLSDFLFHTDGAQNIINIKFEEELVCGDPASAIKSSKVGKVSYAKFNSAAEHVPAKILVDAIIDEAELSNYSFSDTPIYKAWEADDTIGNELLRNLALAMTCVLVITVIMLADFKICILVLATVILTLLDVTGFIYFWGLTIDTISCICIILIVGLCVDYAAHIAHAFIVSEGSSAERAANGLTEMGPAILNGGITTFLALVMLAFADSYGFTVFFKIFSLTVLFGLFHGLIFLPVMLTLLGTEKFGMSLTRWGQSSFSQSNGTASTGATPSPAPTPNGISNPRFTLEDEVKLKSRLTFAPAKPGRWAPIRL
jgi:Niemann-Pick C1 protein